MANFKRDAWAQWIILLGPLVFGGLYWAALRLSKYGVGFHVSLAIVLGVGFIFFLVAKLSLIRHGKLFTIGSSEMTTAHRRLYRLGYAMMMLAGFLALVSMLPMKL